jgi:hypothetical protein
MQAESTNNEHLLRELAAIRHQIAALQELTQAYHHTDVLLDEKTRLLALSAEIGTALAGSESLRAILQRCAEAIATHLNVALACIWTFTPEEELLEMQASAGIYLPLDSPRDTLPVTDSSVIGHVAHTRRPYITNTVLDDPHINETAWARQQGLVAFAGYPLLVENRLVGVMALFARTALTEAAQQSLAWVASGIALGIDRICVSDALARSVMNIVGMNKRLRQKHAEHDEFV